MVPYSPVGKILAAWCSIFGVIIFGLPIPIIVLAFSKYYAVVNNKHSRTLLKYNLSRIKNIDDEGRPGGKKKGVRSNMGVNGID